MNKGFWVIVDFMLEWWVLERLNKFYTCAYIYSMYFLSSLKWSMLICVAQQDNQTLRYCTLHDIDVTNLISISTAACIQAFQNKWRFLYTFILVSLKSKLKVFMLFFIPCPLAVIRDRKKISTLFNSFGCVVNVISLVDNLVKFDFICFEMKKVFLCIKKYIWLFCYRS